MKFSSSLKFNAISDWWDAYIDYDTLKTAIYQLEKAQHARRTSISLPRYRDEEQTLIDTHDRGELDEKFAPLLLIELEKISAFYAVTAAEFFSEVTLLEEEIRKIESDWAAGGKGAYRDYSDDELDEEDEESDEDSPVRQRRTSFGGKRFPTTGKARPARDKSLLSHRYSISSSSSDGHSHALDSSVMSLPPHAAAGPSTGGTGTVRKLANKLASSISSLPGRARSASFSLPSSSPIDPPRIQRAESVWLDRGSEARNTQMILKRKILGVWVKGTNLKSYVEVNESGFGKILKKYDKVTSSTLKPVFLSTHLHVTSPFDQTSKSALSETLSTLTNLYSTCVCQSNEKRARAELKSYQRENIAWERDTVWKMMIGRERRGTGTSSPSEFISGPRAVGSLARRPKPGYTLYIPLPGRRRLAIKGKVISLSIAIAVFAILLNADIVKKEDGEEAGAENRCLAILIFSTIMWATEAVPLFVTSLLVPLLLVCFRAVRAEKVGDKLGEVLAPPEATQFIFKMMFSPTIMLLIGGFTISSALSKTAIDRILITRVLSFAGSRPSTVLLAVMGVSCFASMWISNVAAPTLCFALVKPILRTLPSKSAFGPALILGIALAANIGGQSSPISSPQNLIAIGEMHPPLDWGKWFAVALPVSFISIILIWGLLLASYRPGRLPPDASRADLVAPGGSGLGFSLGEGQLEIKPIRPTREPFTLKQYWVSFVCLVTIGMWCVAHELDDYLGDMGVIAIIPIVAFFATGVLKKDDFEQFAWTIVFLAMGGIALGKGVVSSGLLDILDVEIRQLVDGFSLYNVVLILSPVVLIISTFISHTIASVLLVPIAKEVGLSLGGGKPDANHANLLIFITGLICSAGMGMPVSGFPNQTAATQEDELGDLYLSNVDFLKNGVPASIIATLVVATVGFLLMKAIGL